MNDLLAWTLQHARLQTLQLARGISDEQAAIQAVPEEHHPAWILGHILLGDVYLLSLLGVENLPPDFNDLISTYGPGAAPCAVRATYQAQHVVISRLTRTGTVRCEAVRRMSPHDLARPTPDDALARTQPTLGHHLSALVLHEGYHAGQLSSWRRVHGFASSGWVLAPTPA